MATAAWRTTSAPVMSPKNSWWRQIRSHVAIFDGPLSLIIFLILRNQKDEKDFEHQINNDYHKTKDEEGDSEIDKVTK